MQTRISVLRHLRAYTRTRHVLHREFDGVEPVIQLSMDILLSFIQTSGWRHNVASELKLPTSQACLYETAARECRGEHDGREQVYAIETRRGTSAGGSAQLLAGSTRALTSSILRLLPHRHPRAL